MREFVSKSKKVRITIEGQSHEMRCPNMGESEALDEKLKEVSPTEVTSVYKKFFSDLGLPSEALDKMDRDDFIDFIRFVLSPKTEGPQTTV